MSISRDDYYGKIYKKLQRTGVQCWGNSLIDRLIESRVERFEDMKILELGASSGEHLRYVDKEPKWHSYIGLDINPGISDPELYANLMNNESSSNLPNITFVKGSAENLPFEDNSFDLIIATCLLAHVRDAEKVLQEARRVVKDNGQITIGLPTDPGILNRLIKKIFTYPKMKRLGILNPKLEYAREHINAVGNLVELIKFNFSDDLLELRFFPFIVRSWNLNLVVIMNCKVRKKVS